MNFDKQQDYILEDDRVILRPLKKDDIKSLCPFAENEPEIWKYSLVVINGEKSLTDYILAAVSARESGEQYAFSVYDKKLNALPAAPAFMIFKGSITPCNSVIPGMVKNFRAPV